MPRTKRDERAETAGHTYQGATSVAMKTTSRSLAARAGSVVEAITGTATSSTAFTTVARRAADEVRAADLEAG